jgi:methyltransferase (TIGR00027 family)
MMMGLDQGHPASLSDTARLTALYRARESARPDRLFDDPLARRLAGERGEEIARTLPFGDRHLWSFTIRTFLFDRLVLEQVHRGVDTVVNLAAGLDTRPYRLPFPPSLRWVEVDVPDVLNSKSALLRGETRYCTVEQAPLDLTDRAGRRDLFERLGRESRKVLVLTEGLLVYLPESEIAELARDLAAPRAFQLWALDLASPGLLQMLQKNLGPRLQGGESALRFGPEQGPLFFEACGWSPCEVSSLLKTAARLRRLSVPMRLLALLPESSGAQGSRPWSAVCLFTRQERPGSS